MKHLGNQPTIEIVQSYSDKWDYIQTANPAVDTNPSSLYAKWLNISTGEEFVCIDNTVDGNTWVGHLGNWIGQIKYFPFTTGSHSEWTLTDSAAYDAGSNSLQLTPATDSANGHAEYAFSLNSYFLMEAEIWSGGGDGADGITIALKTDSSTIARIDYQEYLDEVKIYLNEIEVSTTDQTNLDNSTWTPIKILLQNNYISYWWNDTYYYTNPVSNEEISSITNLLLSGNCGGLNNYHRIRNIELTYG